MHRPQLIRVCTDHSWFAAISVAVLSVGFGLLACLEGLRGDAHAQPNLLLLAAQCIHFAVFWDAQSCVELCIDSLTKVDLLHLSIEDVEALLDLPGAVQVVESQQRKVEEVCRKRLMQEFKNVPQVLADDALTHRLSSLSPSALELLCRCDLGSREGALCLLALWFSRAQSLRGTVAKKLLPLISTADASQLLSLPPVCKGAGLCRDWLLHYFGNVYSTIKNGRSRSFCSLSFPVVRLWASLDELQVHNENDVAVLLSFWCSANASRAVTQQNFNELSALLRVGCMSPPFSHFTLPKLSWFTKSAVLPYFNVAWGVDGGNKGCGFGISGRSDADVVPPAWAATPRLPAVMKNATLEHSFPKSEVVSMVESAHAGSSTSIFSPPMYYGGYYWAHQVQCSMPVSSLGIYLQSTTRPPLPEPSLAKASYTLRIQKQGVRRRVNVTSGASIWFKGRAGWGKSGLLDVRSAKQLDELLVDDQLCVSCQLKDVA
eukprot:1156494-Pelagomonas_calceolata.AAC.2